MALNVYLTRDDVSPGIRIIDKNDIFFDGYTYLGISDFEIAVLKGIDEAKRIYCNYKKCKVVYNKNILSCDVI